MVKLDSLLEKLARALGDLKANFMFTSAIVASSISEAVGYSLAIKMKKVTKE